MKKKNPVIFWEELIHNGPYFIKQTYEPMKKGCRITYFGKQNHLEDICITDPEEEEFLFYFCRYISSSYFDDIFQKNFWQSWNDITDRKDFVNNYKDIDLDHLKTQFSGTNKIKREVPDDKYTWCLIDKKKVKLENFVVEPPAIFIGRGKHPDRGKIKRKLRPEDVTINLSSSKFIPEPNIPGKWKDVIENNELCWMASWVHSITKKTVYMYLSSDSLKRMDKSKEKFDNARQLNKYISKIRSFYKKLIFGENNIKMNQIGIIIFLIDTLWVRVGSQRDSGNNTYGISTILKKHIKFLQNNVIHLKFPGKDSILYENKVSIPNKVYDMLLDYKLDKNNITEYLFSYINSNLVNTYLREILPFLSSKIFRTFNASLHFERCLLQNINKKKPESISDFQYIFTYCNSIIARKCNHRVKQKQQSPSNKKKKNDLSKMKLGLNLGTSIKNYIDPRIIFAYCKNNSIEIEKIVSPKIYKHIEWAKNTPGTWKYK